MKDTRPRVIFLVPRYGMVERGVETFTYELVKRLEKNFHIVILGRNGKLPNSRGIWCIPEKKNKLWQWLYKLHPQITKTLDTYFLNPFGIEMLTYSIAAFPYLLFMRADVIFAQAGIWSAISCRIIRFLKGTPFIYKTAGGIEPPIIRQNPDYYVATTPRYFDWIRAYRPHVRVTLIPNGVDTNFFSNKVRPVRLLLEKPIYICVAALIPQKRIEATIKAVAGLPHGSLLVIGEGEFENKIRDMGNKLLGKKRFLVRVVPYEQMPTFYAAADVFTLASEREPFGIAYIEAMACGLPVVTEDDRNRRYIIGKAGLLVDTFNGSHYTRALASITQKKFGTVPLKQAYKFRWERVAQAHARIMLQLVVLRKERIISGGLIILIFIAIETLIEIFLLL